MLEKRGREQAAGRVGRLNGAMSVAKLKIVTASLNA